MEGLKTDNQILEGISTKEIVGELKNREGVKFIKVPPYEKYLIETEKEGIKSDGPSTIIEVID